MHDLLTKYFRGDISENERKRLFSLMENDPELKRTFTSVQNTYAITSLLPAATDQINGIKKLEQFKQKRNRKNRYRLARGISGYAAICMIGFFMAWLVIKESGHAVAKKEIVAYEEFRTPAGQRAMVKLYDGTIVWLNARSSLRYPNVFANRERKVELDGEAFFEVAQMSDEPFVVSTENIDIKVLGTKFNVHAYRGRNEFNTSLIEGSLKIYNQNNERNAIYIEPYESVELLDNKLIKKHFSSIEFLLWKDGIYAFDDIQFLEIIKKLELYYEITIHVDNQKLSEYKFTGKFRQRDGVESVLRTMQTLYYFTFIKDDEKNSITIK